MGGCTGGWREQVGRERHFHQDYPAAENFIWESGPVLTEHTETHTAPQEAASPQLAQESPPVGPSRRALLLLMNLDI